MALSIQIPLQAVQYISTVNVSRAAFNVPAAGKYSFNVAGNTLQTVLSLEINSVYLIERMFVSGNIAAEDFLSSIDATLPVTDMPFVLLKRKLNPLQAHVQKIPVIQYSINRESPIIVYSDKKGDELQISATGILQQIANTVGVDPVILCIGLSIYQINEKYFNQGYKMSMSADFGLDKRRSS